MVVGADPVTGQPLPQRPSLTAARILRSPVGLARGAVVMLGLVIAADLFSLYASFHADGLLADLESGTGIAVSEAELERADYLMAGSGMVQILALLAAAVVFIIWFLRVRENADAFAPDLQRRKPGWAIGAWFIPIANFWMPRGIAVDVWTASSPDPYGADREASRPLLNAWWAVWVVSLLLGRFAGRRYDKAESVDEIREAVDLLVIADLVDIAGAVLAILFVRKLTGMQHRKALHESIPVGA